MNKCIFAGAGAALLVACGSAQAAFFSFASDSADHSWVYTGNGANITNATNGSANPITLLVDDDNGVAAPLQVSVAFSASYQLTFVGSTTVGSSTAYNYAANGTFTFTDIASGTPLLTTTFANALFTARGNATSWFSTGSLQVDDSGGATVSMVWGGANLPAFGLAPGSLNGSPRGFSFDLSTINTSGSLPYNGTGAGVAINASTKLPSATWFSESSFSGSARVPTPGATALLGLGGLMVGRRRRR
jgi:MYXO-CTERM domain-containing protein